MDLDIDQPLQFPHYQPPNPHGIPVADPKFHKPLFKLLKQIARPLKTRTKPFRTTKQTRKTRKKKRPIFY